MRILFFSSYYAPAFGFGGTTTSLAALCEGLAHQGAQVTVLTTNADRQGRLQVRLAEPVEVNGVEVWYFPVRWDRFGTFHAPEQMSALDSHLANCDLLHAFTLWTVDASSILKACREKNKPYVITVNGQLYPWALRQKRLKKRLFLLAFGQRYLKQAAGVHCTEPAEAEALRQLTPLAHPFVVPNGVDLERFTPSIRRYRFRNEFGIPEQAYVLLFLGRLNRIKRPDIAVQVAANLANPLVYLIVAGPDEQGLSQELRDQAAAAGIGSRVHFTGLLPSSDVQQLLSETDLLIMPTEVHENFGMAALEALAVGVPVLVSEGIPVGRWADQAGAGKIVPCDPLAFSTAAAEMLTDPERLAEMGRRGQELARRFDRDLVAGQMIIQYRAILETGKPLSSQ
jgi:glycosyltransferase involved in cell wall biosynthesis